MSGAVADEAGAVVQIIVVKSIPLSQLRSQHQHSCVPSHCKARIRTPGSETHVGAINDQTFEMAYAVVLSVQLFHEVCLQLWVGRIDDNAALPGADGFACLADRRGGPAVPAGVEAGEDAVWEVLRKKPAGVRPRVVGGRGPGAGLAGVRTPARPFPSSIFLDKNRRDIGKSQSIWTDSKMETAGSRRGQTGGGAADVLPVLEHLSRRLHAQHFWTSTGVTYRYISDEMDRTRMEKRQAHIEVGKCGEALRLDAPVKLVDAAEAAVGARLRAFPVVKPALSRLDGRQELTRVGKETALSAILTHVIPEHNIDTCDLPPSLRLSSGDDTEGHWRAVSVERAWRCCQLSATALLTERSQFKE
jgi:hypothetical protein